MLPEQVRDRPGRGSHTRIRDARHDRSGSRIARGRWTWSRPSSENDLADDVENKSAGVDKHDDPSRVRESTKHGSKTRDSGYEIITTVPELERLSKDHRLACFADARGTSSSSGSLTLPAPILRYGLCCRTRDRQNHRHHGTQKRGTN